MGVTFNARVNELTLQTPHATVHSSLVADAWFAWHSIPIKKKNPPIKCREAWTQH